MLSRVVPAVPGLPPVRETLISVAPMMDRTDRHFRYFLRILAPDIRLYTEMLTAEALLRGDCDRLLDHHPSEHPLALQLGGSEPQLLAEASAMAAEWGYDEINLNIGCPSDRVQSGRFGACLMSEPGRVADCVAAIGRIVSLPVTVKTRIGIDDRDDFAFLQTFVASVADAGCSMFIIHARKAILSGLSPKENRTVPPLLYSHVYELRALYPQLRVIINGGVRTLVDVARHLEKVDGVMIGREAYRNPYWLTQLQSDFLSPAFGRDWKAPTRREVVEEMARYAESEMAKGTELKHIARHMLGLFSESPGARNWRRFLSQQVSSDGGANRLLDSLALVDNAAA